MATAAKKINQKAGKKTTKSTTNGRPVVAKQENVGDGYVEEKRAPKSAKTVAHEKPSAKTTQRRFLSGPANDFFSSSVSARALIIV